MKIIKKSTFFTLILAVSLMAAAQTPKLTPVGSWTGFAENQGNQDDITVIIEKKDDAYTGKVNDAMGMFANVEIKNIVWKDTKVTFEFPGSINGMAFNIKAELTLTETTMKGIWTMIEDGSSGGIDLTRR